MKEYRMNLVLLACGLFLIGIFFGNLAVIEYTRGPLASLPESVRVERSVFRDADVILGGEIKEQATVQLTSYSEFDRFARKHNEHLIVVVSRENNDAIAIRYLISSKRYYFIETIYHPWGWKYGIRGSAFDGSAIVIHAGRKPLFLMFILVALGFLSASLWFFPWRAVHSFHPATT